MYYIILSMRIISVDIKSPEIHDVIFDKPDSALNFDGHLSARPKNLNQGQNFGQKHFHGN